jgi:SAM-dependent methyltransferase
VTSVSHPIFARVFDRFSRAMESDVGPYREQLLAGLSGRVLEVGAGNGMNFGHYPATVEEVIALEPEPYLRERAQEAARSAPVAVAVRDGVAAPLPLEDDAVDAAVASLVLCSVPAVDAAAAELRRVLRPGGELRFFEHVRSARPRKARLQRALDASGVWPALVGGCHTARDTVGVLERAGFAIASLRREDVGSAADPTNPHVLGTAVNDPGVPLSRA